MMRTILIEVNADDSRKISLHELTEAEARKVLWECVKDLTPTRRVDPYLDAGPVTPMPGDR